MQNKTNLLTSFEDTQLIYSLEETFRYPIDRRALVCALFEPHIYLHLFVVMHVKDMWTLPSVTKFT